MAIECPIAGYYYAAVLFYGVCMTWYNIRLQSRLVAEEVQFRTFRKLPYGEVLLRLYA